MAADLMEERKRFQGIHIIPHLKKGQDPTTHPQFDALGREFDAYTNEHKEAIGVELKKCETIIDTYNAERINLKAQDDRVGHLDAKGYPGGEAQEYKEFMELKECYFKFLKTRHTLNRHLIDLKSIQRNYAACSTFAYTSIEQIQNIIAQHRKDVEYIGKGLKERVTRWRDAKEERTGMLMEGTEEGDIDYVAPLLKSNPTWVRVKSIGGGMGSASLWARVDDSGTVQERVVRKDTKMEPSHWNDARYWVDDSSAVQGKIHLEYHCHARAEKQPNGSNIVKPRKFEFDEKTMTHRIYTNYCPLGDLYSLIKANNKDLKTIPEAWVWMLFSALVECGLAMETDCNASSEDRIPTEIVHRDLKPANVFLDLATKKSWPEYPQPKVGDFGLAVETCLEDSGNPLRWRGLAGTPGYYAPEQYDLGRDPLPKKVYRLLSHTNVWGIGRIMLDIVNQSSGHDEKEPVYHPNGMFDGLSSFKDGAQQQYSYELLFNIGSCLQWHPKNRPSFAELRKSFDKHMAPPEHEPRNNLERRRAYMFNARNGVQPEEEEHRLYGLPAEQYREGMVLQKLKPQKAGGSATAGPGASRR